MAVERDRGEWETEGRPGLGKEDRNGYGETKKEGRRDKEKEGGRNENQKKKEEIVDQIRLLERTRRLGRPPPLHPRIRPSVRSDGSGRLSERASEPVGLSHFPASLFPLSPLDRQTDGRTLRRTDGH